VPRSCSGVHSRSSTTCEPHCGAVSPDAFAASSAAPAVAAGSSEQETRTSAAPAAKHSALKARPSNELRRKGQRPTIRNRQSGFDRRKQMDLRKVPVGKKAPYDVNVIIEIPMGGNPVKYELDKESGAIFVDRFLHTAMYLD
jgi:hypothetical protein